MQLRRPPLLLGLLILVLLAVSLCAQTATTGAAGADAAKAEAAAATTVVKKGSNDATSIATAAAAAAKATAAAAEAATTAVEAAGGGGDEAEDKQDEKSGKPAEEGNDAAAKVNEAKPADAAAKPAGARPADDEPAGAKPADADATSEKKDAAVAPKEEPKQAGAAGDAVDRPADDTAEVAAGKPDPGSAADSAKGPTNKAKKQRNKEEAFTSQVVDFAPAVNVTFGDDIDDEGKCAAEINKYCEDVNQGEGKLGDCISETIASSEMPTPGDDVPEISDACRDEVYSWKISRSRNINANIPLAKACKLDAEKFCNVTWFFGYKSGQVISCLRDIKAQVAKPCKEQVFKVMLDGAIDFRADPMLYEACKEDADNMCKDVKNGGGRIQACLRDKRMSLSWACEEQLFRQEMENADDIRLSVRLFSKCLPDKRKFCKDVQPGNARTTECLEEHGEELSSACKEEVDSMLERRVQDFRLDRRLSTACEDDLFILCTFLEGSTGFQCLVNRRDQLSPVCRATVFNREVLYSEDIDFQYPMKAACDKEIQRFCKEVPHGSARVIRCLQDNKEEKDFGKACADEIFGYEAEISKDHRLNYRLHKACQKEVDKLCPGLCQNSDGSSCGKVLRCLTDKIDDVSDEACRKEVDYFKKMEMSNFKNDVPLAEACRADGKKYCNNIEPGEGRVHKCLRDNRKRLGDACRKEELLLEEKEADAIDLDVSLLKSCKAESQLFCTSVQPGQARGFRCLAENMNDAAYSSTCRYQIYDKLQRRQANWKLDPPLRKACTSDVRLYCNAEDAKNSEQGLVYKCLVSKFESLDGGCQKELGHAIHMAFFAWQTGAILTAVCDDDVNRLCLAKWHTMATRPGAVGTCLAQLLEKQEQKQERSLRRSVAAIATAPGLSGGTQLSEACYRLADIAEPPSMKQVSDSSLAFALIKDQLESIEVNTSLPTISHNRQGEAQGVSLTGWMAMLSMTAFVVVVIFGATYAYKRSRGVPEGLHPYTLVVEQEDK